jgi:GDP-L-fucose synthase
MFGFHGKIVVDSEIPDGTPRKLPNVERMRKLGWKTVTTLWDGIAWTYTDFLTKVTA